MTGMMAHATAGVGSLPWLAAAKVQGRHRERLAVVYVRQSTMQQVARHQESTRLQYGLVERALELGWARAGVEVIDDELGKSGASAEGRLGFQRLISISATSPVFVTMYVHVTGSPGWICGTSPSNAPSA